MVINVYLGELIKFHSPDLFIDVKTKYEIIITNVLLDSPLNQYTNT